MMTADAIDGKAYSEKIIGRYASLVFSAYMKKIYYILKSKTTNSKHILAINQEKLVSFHKISMP